MGWGWEQAPPHQAQPSYSLPDEPYPKPKGPLPSGNWGPSPNSGFSPVSLPLVPLPKLAPGTGHGQGFCMPVSVLHVHGPSRAAAFACDGPD